MPSQETLYDVADRVATITLNRPDKLNAWTAVMEQEVRTAMCEAERDDNARVIVLTGAGRGFCAGADMSLLQNVADRGVDKSLQDRVLRTSERQAGVRPDFQKKYSYFPAIGKPVIAAINGPVVGLGLVIALYCDLRWVSMANCYLPSQAFKSHLNRNTPDGLRRPIRESYLQGFHALTMLCHPIPSFLPHPRLSPTINVSDNTTVTLLRRSQRSIEDSFGRE